MKSLNKLVRMTVIVILIIISNKSLIAQYIQTSLTTSNIADIHTYSDNLIMAVDEGGSVIYISTDLGQNWEQDFFTAFIVALSEPIRSNNIPPEEGGLFAVGSDNSMSQPKAFKWDGVNWNDVQIGGTGRLLGAAVNDQTIVFVGDAGSWRSTDAGISFEPGVGLMGAANVIYNDFNNKWYAAGFTGIQTSSDGHSWGPPITNTIVNKMAINPINGDIALATAFTEVKLLSINGNVTTLNNGWPTNAYPNGIAYDSEGTLYASYINFDPPIESGILFSVFSLYDWGGNLGGIENEIINDSDIGVHFSFHPQADTSFLFVATTNGVWKMSLGITDVQDGTKIPGKFILEQNYPNPFNPSTTISWYLPEQGNVSLKVYDILGNEVATLVNEEKPIGEYEIKFDASGFTSGVYFYKLQAGSFVETKKMVLMK